MVLLTRLLPTGSCSEACMTGQVYHNMAGINSAKLGDNNNDDNDSKINEQRLSIIKTFKSINLLN